MTKRQIRRFFDIPQVMFLQYALLLGGINFLFSSRHTWQGSLIFGVFVSGVTTITAQKAKAKRREKYHLDNEQFYDLDDALQTGKLPKDKKVRAALPAYLDERMKWYNTQRVKVYCFCFILAGLLALWGALGHDVGLLIVAALLFALCAYSYAAIEKLPGKVAALRAQL